MNISFRDSDIPKTRRELVSLIFKIAFLEAMALSLILPSVTSTGEIPFSDSASECDPAIPNCHTVDAIYTNTITIASCSSTSTVASPKNCAELTSNNWNCITSGCPGLPNSGDQIICLVSFSETTSSNIITNTQTFYITDNSIIQQGTTHTRGGGLASAGTITEIVSFEQGFNSASVTSIVSGDDIILFEYGSVNTVTITLTNIQFDCYLYGGGAVTPF